jgi:hypothetical protein
MYVPSYQMHNVLHVYSKQLRQNTAAAEKSASPAKPRQDRVNLTPKVKRRATIEKVSKDILSKISSYGLRHNNRQPAAEYAEKRVNQAGPSTETGKQTFVFNAIDTINHKSQNTLSVDDSSFWIRRLDQLAKQAGNKTPPP